MDKAKRALWGLSLGHFMLDIYAAVLIPLYPFIAQRLEINLAAISLVIAIGHGVSSILQPVWGYISDKFNKRFFMFFGIIFSSIFVPLGYIAPNALILMLCLILGMAGNAFYHPQATSMVKDFFKGNIELSHALGIFLGLGTIGYAMGPYLSTYIVDKFGGNNFIFIGLIGITVAFFILFFVPKIEKKEIINTDNFYLALKEIVKNKTCLLLILITIIKASLIMSYGTYIPFLLKEYNFSITQIGFIITAFYVAGGISMIYSSRLEKIIKLKGMILTSYLPLLPLTIISILLLKYSKILATMFFIITGFFVLLAAGCVLAHAQKIMPKYTGTISGIIQGFTLSMGALLLIPFGILGQNLGVYWILILISSIAGLMALYCAKTKLI